MLEEFLRRQVVQGAVRSFFIVVDPPILDNLPRVIERLDQVLIQALVPEPAVEALAVGVLFRLVRPDEVECCGLTPMP